MNGGFGGRFVPALLGAAVGGGASTEMISATGLEARRERGRHQPTGHLTPKIAGTVVQLGGIAPGVLSVAWRRSFGAMTPRRYGPLAYLPINRSVGPTAPQCRAFEAGHDPHRSLMNVIGQIFRRIEQPQKSLADHARGGFTRPIPWGNLLVPRTLVQGSDRLLDLWIADYQELPALHISAARRTHQSPRSFGSARSAPGLVSAAASTEWFG